MDLPITLSSQEKENYPEFSKLISQLSTHIEVTGCSKTAKRDLNEVGFTLKLTYRCIIPLGSIHDDMIPNYIILQLYNCRTNAGHQEVNKIF